MPSADYPNRNTGVKELNFKRMQDIAIAIQKGDVSGDDWHLSIDKRYEKDKQCKRTRISKLISDGWTAEPEPPEEDLQERRCRWVLTLFKTPFDPFASEEK